MEGGFNLLKFILKFRTRSRSVEISADSLLRAHRCSITAAGSFRRSTPATAGVGGPSVVGIGGTTGTLAGSPIGEMEVRRHSYTSAGDEPKPHGLQAAQALLQKGSESTGSRLMAV